MSNAHSVSPATVIRHYIDGKDGNRPALFTHAFTADARVRIESTNEVVPFPAEMDGRDAITQHLASDFALRFENVYTFCLIAAPDTIVEQLSCPWLVAMSAKDGDGARIGCGHYHWRFDASGHGLCTRLHIHIADMLALPTELSPAIDDWVQGLPYPWVDARDLAARMPADDQLAPVNAWLATLHVVKLD